MSARRGPTPRHVLVGLAAAGAVLGAAWALQSRLDLRLDPPSWTVRRGAGGGEPAPLGATAAARSPAVVINEVMTVNPDVVFDEDLEPSDWIELYNRSARTVSLRDWSLADGRTIRNRWVLPDVPLGPRETLLVWASGKDRVGGAAARFTAVTLDPDLAPNWRRRFDDRQLAVHEFLPRLRRTRFHSVEADIEVPEAGAYTLWIKARARETSAATVKVSVDGARTIPVAVQGGLAFRHVRVPSSRLGDRPWSLRAGRRRVVVSAAVRSHAVELERVALAREGDVEDRYALHLHASFRLRPAGEAVALLDPLGAVQDRVTPRGAPPGSSLQRVPDGGPELRAAAPTPAGRLVRGPPDLSGSPGVALGPVTLAPSRPPGVEELRVTLDGTIPTARSPRLEAALRIARPGVVRVRGFTRGRASTAVATRQLWIGPLPSQLVAMVAIDPALLGDPDVGLGPNSAWRRAPARLPGPPALRELQQARARDWTARTRPWTKRAHLLLLDRDGAIHDGPVRLRLQGDGTSFEVGLLPGLGPERLARDPFEPPRTPPPRQLLVDGARNTPLETAAYELVRASGAEAPRTRLGLVLVNGRAEWPPDRPDGRIVLVEEVNGDFLASRWGAAPLDLIKGKPFRVVQGSLDAFHALADHLDRGRWSAAELAALVDLEALVAYHVALVFVDPSRLGPQEGVQGYLVLDRSRTPPLLRPVAWDLDRTFASVGHDTLSEQIRALGREPYRSRFLPARLVADLLARDPAFRATYLRHAERMLNHVFVPRLLARARELAALGHAAPAARLHAFARRRPRHVRASMAAALSVPPPSRVQVHVVGRGRLRIDGVEYGAAYDGHYFAGGMLTLEVPEDARRAFRHFVVNGERADGPHLRRPVDTALEVSALFDS